MEKIKELSVTTTTATTQALQIQNQIQSREQQRDYNIDQSSRNHPTSVTNLPIKVEEPKLFLSTTVGKFSSKIFLLFFYLHLVLVGILIIFLAIRGAIAFSTHNHHNFQPLEWYPPLLTSSGCATALAFSWVIATRLNPSKTIRTSLWLSPLLTLGVGILLLAVGSAGGLTTSVFALVFALIQSLYACWVRPRLNYTSKILSVCLGSAPPPSLQTTIFTAISILVGLIYSCFVVVGVGGATVTWTRFDPLFVFVTLLSLAWTMHVIKNVSHVSISRVNYTYLAREIVVDARVAFKDTWKYLMGSVCLGSVLVPILGVVHGSARSMSLVAGETDEFMFSCTSCYSGVAGKLVTYGNRWGFVHVGVYGKGIVQSSSDTWEMFRRVEMESLINSDLTGSFFFLCGVASGSLCSLVGGSWSFVVDKNHTTEISIYSFLIGYFMSRIAMSWPQACVSAYHVAFAENPQSRLFDSTISDRIQELQRTQVSSSEISRSRWFDSSNLNHLQELHTSQV